MPPAKKAAPTPKKAAAKKAAPAKAAAQATVTLKHLAAALADSHDIAKKQAEAVLGDLVTLTTRHLKRGDKIRLTGLGILQVRKRGRQDGTEPGDRRDHQDQGQQEGRVPACQGTERGGVGQGLWLTQHTLFDGSRLPYGRRMGTAGRFIVELQRERRIGNVSSETEQHLKHEFRTLGRDASDSALAAAVGSEIDRLSREAETLRKLRAVLFGVA